jgi:hypothetical protein
MADFIKVARNYKINSQQHSIIWCSVILSGSHGGATVVPYCVSINCYPTMEKNKVDLLDLPTWESAIHEFVKKNSGFLNHTSS